MSEVVVVGAGIAGTAAAITLARGGASVTIVAGPPGATHLAPGVLDGAVTPQLAELVAALDGYDVAPCEVATVAGVVRTGVARDRALLDLATLAAGEVLVPRAPRANWDADALARMLSAAPLAEARGLRFRAVDAVLMRLADERVVPDATFAARHDDPARLDWLAERIRAFCKESSSAVAVLLPPCLGVERERATSLATKAGVRVGELAVGLAGPAGFRFANARDRALASALVRVVRGYAKRVDDDGAAVTVTLESGEALRAGACVLATGGLVGGGITYHPSEATPAPELPSDPRPYARASLAGAPVGVRGLPLDVPGSLFGVAPEALAWPFVEDGDLENVGILADEAGRVRGRARLYACGDVLADRPRTWMQAARSGIDAARAVLTPSAGAEDRARSSG